MEPVRVLIYARISNLTDSSTGIDRQIAACRRYLDGRPGWVEAGTAEDPHVSARRVPPAERPGLGPWFSELAAEFDILLVWSLDRLVRRVSDLAAVVAWAQSHGPKRIVSVTEPVFDMASSDWSLAAKLLALFAEMEGAATSRRQADFREWIRKSPRWPGGMPAYGYEVFRDVDGCCYLRANPSQVAVLRDLARRLLAGESPARLAEELNGRGEPSPRGARPSRRIRESGRCYRWTAAGIRKMLKSEALLGYKMQASAVPGKKYWKSVPVTGADGLPVRMAAPVFSEEEWQRLQRHLRGREERMGPVVHRTPFGGSLRCGFCRGRLGLHVSRRTLKDGSVREYPKLRCRTPRADDRGRTRYGCAGQISYDPAEALEVLGELLLARHGDQEAAERIYVNTGASGGGWAWRGHGGTIAERWSAALRAEREEIVGANGIQVYLRPGAAELASPDRLVLRAPERPRAETND